MAMTRVPPGGRQPEQAVPCAAVRVHKYGDFTAALSTYARTSFVRTPPRPDPAPPARALEGPVSGLTCGPDAVSRLQLVGRRPHAHLAGRRRASGPPPGYAAAWPAPSSTAITEPSTAPVNSSACVPSWGRNSPWERSAPARTTLSPSHSTRNAPWRPPLRRSPRLPPCGLPLDHPLQHPPTALGERTPGTDRLRTAVSYPHARRATTRTGVHSSGATPGHLHQPHGPCPGISGQGPCPSG
jgi:hypothetical protein